MQNRDSMALVCAQKYHHGCGVLYKTHLVRKCTADRVFVRLCAPRCYVSSSALVRDSDPQPSWNWAVRGPLPREGWNLLISSGIKLFRTTVFIIYTASNIYLQNHLCCAAAVAAWSNTFLLTCLHIQPQSETWHLRNLLHSQTISAPRCTANELELHTISQSWIKAIKK